MRLEWPKKSLLEAVGNWKYGRVANRFGLNWPPLLISSLTLSLDSSWGGSRSLPENWFSYNVSEIAIEGKGQ